MQPTLEKSGILSADDFWLRGGIAPGSGSAVVKFSLVLHLIVVAVVAIWLIWDAKRPPPPPSSFVELVDLAPQAPPAPVAPKPVVQEPPPRPEPQTAPPEPKAAPLPTPPEVAKPLPPQELPKVTESVPTESAALPEVVEEVAQESGMELPTFSKKPPAPAAAVAVAAAGVIGSASDPRVNVYNAQIRAAVEPRWRPPSIDAVAPGTRAIVSFSIDRSGAQIGVSLSKSSGNDLLDQLALRAVTLARFPPLPAAITSDPYPVQYGFVYEGR